MAAAGDRNPTPAQMHPAAASFAGQSLPLTEHNLKQLQPYIIRPMSPVTISSSHSQSNADHHCTTDYTGSHGGVDDADYDDQEDATDGMEPTVAVTASAAARKAEADAKGGQAKIRAARDVARFRFWVYNAMQTLLDLGPEGVAIVEADELYIAGPGDVRLKPRGPCDKAISGRAGVDKQVVPDGGNATASNTKNVDDADAACPQNRDLLPNLGDPRYWRDKMRHLTHLCKPLSQARRLERRLAAKNEAANPSLWEEPQEDARMDAWRAEQSRLIYRENHSRIAKWVLGLDAQTPTRPSTPLYDDEADQAMELRRRGGTLNLKRRSDDVAAGPFDFNPAPPSSDSSIVEITPMQFVEATRDRDRQNTPQAFTAQTTGDEGASTMAPTTAPTTATNCNSERQPEAKKQKSTGSSPQSSATQRTRAVQPPLASALPESPEELFANAPQPTAAKHSGVETATHTIHNGAVVLGKRQRGASEDNEPQK